MFNRAHKSKIRLPDLGKLMSRVLYAFGRRCTWLYRIKKSLISNQQMKIKIHERVFASSFPAALLSVLGNASVLFSAGRRLDVLKAPELLTVNLAVTDIGMALSMYPLSIAAAFNHAWMGGDATCLYYGLMGMVFSITSIMTLAAMGMIRYLVAGSPRRKGKSGRRDSSTGTVGQGQGHDNRGQINRKSFRNAKDQSGNR